MYLIVHQHEDLTVMRGHAFDTKEAALIDAEKQIGEMARLRLSQVRSPQDSTLPDPAKVGVPCFLVQPVDGDLTCCREGQMTLIVLQEHASLLAIMFCRRNTEYGTGVLECLAP